MNTKIYSSLGRRFHWLNVPGAMLVALLQRTPVLRIAATAEEFVLASPAAAVLRSAIGAIASFGALHSLAGATPLVTNGHPSPLATTVGAAIPSVFFTVEGTQTPPASWRVDGSIPPGLSFSGLTSPGLVNISTLQLSGTPTMAGQFSVTLQAFEGQNGSLTPSPVYDYVINVDAGSGSPPSITGQPSAQAVDAGGTATLMVSAAGSPPPAFQWQVNGTALGGATASTLTLANLQPANTGIYTVVLSNSAGTVTSIPALVGVSTTSKVIGAGSEVGSDIFVAANGNTYDQVLLTGAAAAVTADVSLNQITRTSFIDLTNDIVQVECSGRGTLSLVLDNASGPAAPVNYNQAVNYMKGHVGIVITGADESTNVSVFSVGRITAVNQSLFRDDVTYDGMADLAFIAISSVNGNFGGVRSANGSYYAAKGVTGIYAPGVQFTGPVFVGDVNASGAATPVLLLGSASDTRITGGDLFQTNGQAVQVSGITQLKFVDGTTSHGMTLPAQNNQGRLEQNGADVTSQIVVNPPAH